MGASASFNGTSSVVDFGDLSVFDGLTTFSVCFWVWLDSTGTGTRLVTQWGDGNVAWITGADPTNSVTSVRIRDEPTNNDVAAASTSGDVTVDTWKHVAWVWDGGNTLRLYIDGVSKGITYSAQNSPVGMGPSDAKVSWGSQASGSIPGYVKGQSAYLHLFDRNLSAEEVKELVYKPGSIMNGCVVYSPGMATGGGGVINDLSGNGNSGTPTDVTFSSDGPPIWFDDEEEEG